MIIEVDFTESNATFDVDFGEVTQLGNPVLIHKEITENGKYNARDDDATGYSSVNVDVPVPDGYIIPDGEIEITDNGVYDVSTYKNANVDIITGEYDIDSVDNGDGTQTLNIVDRDGSGIEKYKQMFNGLIDRTISGNLVLDVDYISYYAFYNRSKITGIYAPNVTTTETSICRGCANLLTFNAPLLEVLKNSSLYDCRKLTSLIVPKATVIETQACYNCTALEVIDLPVADRIGGQTFYNNSNLKALILRVDKVCQLSNISTFTGTPIASGNGFVYVNDNRYEEYLVATNWVTIPNQIKPISELPEEVLALL